jgi:hypothetical protein
MKTTRWIEKIEGIEGMSRENGKCESDSGYGVHVMIREGPVYAKGREWVILDERGGDAMK